MATPESRVKAKVNKALKMLDPHAWWFMPVQTGFGRPALDYICCVKGRFVAIETKAPGGKMTPQQLSTRATMERAGGIVLVVYDDDTLAIALKILLALEYETQHDDHGHHGDGQAGAALPAQAFQLYEQHMRTFQQDETVERPTRRHSRPPGAAPQ